MIKRFFLILFSLVLLTPLALFIYLHTDAGKQTVIRLVSESLEQNFGYQLEIQSLDYSIPFKWKFHHLKIRDQEGLILKVNDADFSLSLWDLWNRRIVIPSFYGQGLSLVKLPAFASNESPTDQKSNFFPVFLQIHHYELNEFSAPVLNQGLEEPINLQGTFRINPFSKTLLFSVEASEKDHFDQTSQFTFNLKQIKQDFEASLKLDDLKHGIFKRRFYKELPYFANFSMQAQTHERSLAHLFSFDVLPEDSLNGQFFLEMLSDPSKDKDLHLEQILVKGDWLYTDKKLRVKNLLINADDYRAQGEVAVDDEAKFEKLLFTLSLPKLPTLTFIDDDILSAKLSADISFQGTLQEFEGHIALKSPVMHIHQDVIEFLTVDIDLQRQHDILNTNAKAQATFKNTPFSAQALLKTNLTTLDTDFSDIKINGLTAEINAEGAYQNNHWLLSSAGHVEDLSQFQSFVNTSLHGKIDFEADIDTRADIAHLHITSGGIKAFDLRFTEPDLTTAVRLKDLTAESSLKLKALSKDDQRLDNIHLITTTNVAQSQAPFELHIEPSDLHAFSLSMQGLISWIDPQWLLKINQFEGRCLEERFLLKEPTEITYESETLDVAPLQLQFAQGLLAAEYHLKPNTSRALLSFQQFPLKVLECIHPGSTWQGTVDGEVHLTKNNEKADGSLHLSLQKVFIDDKSMGTIPEASGRVDAQLNESLLDAQIQISGLGVEPVQGYLKLPIDYTGYWPTVQTEQPIEGQLSLQSELAPFLQLLDLDTFIINGQLALNMRIEGTLSAPNVQGTADISNGIFENTTFGTVLRNLTANVSAQNRLIRLSQLSASDASGGQVQGTGSIDLNDPAFPYQFNFQLTSAQLLKLDYAEANISGNLAVEGNKEKGAIRGSLTTDQVKASLPDKSSAPSLESVEVTYINIPKRERSPIIVENSSSSYPIELAITLDIPSNAELTGQDLTSRWKGNIKVEGTTAAPLLFGEILVVSGEFRFNGKVFEFKEGSVNFNGDLDKKTTLYLVISKDLGEIVAEIILKGTPKKPAISFRSNPPLPQREVLSWILFGHGSPDNTSFQGAQLDQSFTELKMGETKSKGPDMLTNLRNRLGIDQIDFSRKENESNDMSLKVGKYISKGVFVTLNKGINDETNRVGIEANLMKNVKLEADVGDDSTAQLLLKWKKDY